MKGPAKNSQPKPQNEEKKENPANGTGESTGKSAEDLPPEPLTNPFWLMERAFEKKLRNLNKREQKLMQLKADKESGGVRLTEAQIEALSKMDEVKLQVVFVEEMQKLNALQLQKYKKAVKNRERQLRFEEKTRSQATHQSHTDQLKSPSQPEMEVPERKGNNKEESSKKKEEVDKVADDKGLQEDGGNKDKKNEVKSDKKTLGNDDNKENEPFVAAAAEPSGWD